MPPPPHRHGRNRSGALPARPPGWSWSAWEDGALALDRQEVWEERPSRVRLSAVQAGSVPRGLNGGTGFVTVAPMTSPRPPAWARRVPQRRAGDRARGVAVLVVLGLVAAVTLLLTAFGSAAPEPVSSTVASPPPAALPAGRPSPQIVAVREALRLQLPVAQSRLTALGYHGAGPGALALEPLGHQGNRGFLGRLTDRVLGRSQEGLVYYRLGGGQGPETSGLDVGAPPGTDVFSPVDGTVVGITDFVLDARRYGVRLDIQPTTAPALVVSLSRLELDPSLNVGSTVVAGRSKVGTVLDLSEVERQTLARYTQDAGNHVAVEARPAAAVGSP